MSVAIATPYAVCIGNGEIIIIEALCDTGDDYIKPDVITEFIPYN